MYSIAWPDMVGSVNVNLIKDRDATLTNLKLILLSDKYALLGDPYFGTNLKRLTFDQNNQVIRDLIIDDIYTAIITFMPQLIVNRRDIKITSDKINVYVEIKVLNMLDFNTDLYNINLTGSEEI